MDFLLRKSYLDADIDTPVGTDVFLSAYSKVYYLVGRHFVRCFTPVILKPSVFFLFHPINISILKKRKSSHNNGLLYYNSIMEAI